MKMVCCFARPLFLLPDVAVDTAAGTDPSCWKTIYQACEVRGGRMPHYLLIGAGLTRDWGGPLSSEVTGSLLADLHNDAALTTALRKGAFESVFQGFQTPAALQFQDAVVNLYQRLNKALLDVRFEFANPPLAGFRVMDFLAKFDAIFTLNQDLLIEGHHFELFGGRQGRWSGVVVPGMKPTAHDASDYGPLNVTWEPSGDFEWPDTMQPFFKLHGSTNWSAGPGRPMMIMGNQKSGAIDAFPILRQYHDFFASSLNKPNAKLMVIGYSFQDEHINAVIEKASEVGLGTYIVDPSGWDVLRDPRMREAQIKVRRPIEDIKLVGELRRPMSAIFSGNDAFARVELMRFFR
jgi:hypothetical protein